MDPAGAEKIGVSFSEAELARIEGKINTDQD